MLRWALLYYLRLSRNPSVLCIRGVWSLLISTLLQHGDHVDPGNSGPD